MNPHGQATLPHLFWVWPGSLSDALYSAQHLDTTDELRKMGWMVTLVTADAAGIECIRGIELHSIPMTETYFIGQLMFHIRTIRLIMRQPAPDVILFHPVSVPWLLPLRFLRGVIGRSQMQLVMDTRTVHMPPREREGLKGRVRRFFLKQMHRAANRWADGQTAITSRMATTVKIPPKRLWGVWPSGVRLERFSAAHAPRTWPLTGEPINIVYVGTLHYERNLIKLSQAVEQANAGGMPFHLSLVGDGTERSDLEAFAAQTNGRISVVPSIPHNEVPGFLARAHVGALPFPDEEKFQVSSPIKLFEYMAAGLPILATRIACHTDVIGDGRYIFWAEDASIEGLAAAMRQIWRERESLEEMGTLSAEAAKSWTWHESAGKLKIALQNGLKRSRGLH